MGHRCPCARYLSRARCGGRQDRLALSGESWRGHVAVHGFADHAAFWAYRLVRELTQGRHVPPHLPGRGLLRKGQPGHVLPADPGRLQGQVDRVGSELSRADHVVRVWFLHLPWCLSSFGETSPFFIFCAKANAPSAGGKSFVFVLLSRWHSSFLSAALLDCGWVR